MLFTEIDQYLEQESDPQWRVRYEQFLIEVARGMPALTIEQTVQVALQTFDLLGVDQCESLTQVIQRAWRLPLRPLSEWQVMGYHAKTTATPILLDTPQEAPGHHPGEPEAHYLAQDMTGAHGRSPAPHDDLLGSGAGSAAMDTSRSWERRLIADPDAATAYTGFSTELPAHTLAMLGNLWKLGAIADWSNELGSATSRQRVNPPAVNGVPKNAHLNRRDAWYHLDLNDSLGRDAFAEISLCVASILAGYSPQVWHNPYVIPRKGGLRMVECEAASYIVCSRLGAPRRRSVTEFFQAHTASDEPLPEGFSWERVLSTASQLEDLMRGDTEPVWTAAEARPGGE